MAKYNIGVGAGVLILKDGKVLMGKRNTSQQKAASALWGGGTWTLPGGKIEEGETMHQAAIRETEEETGIKLDKVKIFCVNTDKNEHAHFITIGLFAETNQEPEVREEAITEWQWFALDGLPEPLYEPSRKILVCYAKKIFSLEDS